MSLEALQDGSFFSLDTANETGKIVDFQIRRRLSSALVSPSVSAFLSNLEICHSGQWHPFEHWLTEKLATVHVPIHNYSQQRWWQRNGRAFRLLDLPLEIRSMIYGHVIGPYVWPRSELDHSESPTKDTVKVFGQAMHNKYSDRWLAFAYTTQYSFDLVGNRPPSEGLSLQFICKQVRAEIREFTKTSTIPHFHDFWMLTDVVPALQGKWLRHISLGFPNSIWFKFLGFDDHRRMVSPDEAPILVLGKIPTLARLDLHFQVSTPRKVQIVND